MRARGWAPASAGSPIGVCVTTSIDRQIAQELAVREEQVAAAVALLDDGATVPFIAKYRSLLRGGFEIGCQALSSPSNALASFRSSVSNPSVNQP